METEFLAAKDPGNYDGCRRAAVHRNHPTGVKPEGVLKFWGVYKLTVGVLAAAESLSGMLRSTDLPATSVWGAITLAASTGTVVVGSPFSGGGLTSPVAAAYDGNGNSWFANSGSLSEFAGGVALSPSGGFGNLNSPAGVAVDASGNVWTANAGDNSISIFVGLGSAVATPLAANVGP